MPTSVADLLKHHFYDAFADGANTVCSAVAPQKIDNPRWISRNNALAIELGLDTEHLASLESLQLMSGCDVPSTLKPTSVVYSGHQFGVWAGQLGDGRAITLGEIAVGTEGELWDLQLKGAGTTPYSRFADGRAVLRSSIREYLCSEAMHGLGIPTTRALCIAHSDSPVYREQEETAAIVCRVARSHIRFGSFEHFHYRDQPQRVKALADYVISRHFPAWSQDPERYVYLLQNTVTQTANTIAQWQAVGFAHGVMNTDNMSILGDTIDYGPFGFMEAYNPYLICNHSDTHGRYSFKNQPAIALWNLNALATSFSSLLPDEQLVECLKQYESHYLQRYRQLMASKLGLQDYQPEDEHLINNLLTLMEKNAVDYSVMFRKLCDFTASNTRIRGYFFEREKFDRWSKDYIKRLSKQGLSDKARAKKMRATNPKYILRNYMAQIAIEKAQENDYSEVNRLLKILQKPYDEHPEAEAYAGLPPDWAGDLSVSCSS
jgi:uncharacterized protein YdiU (UPF0061 family)